MYGGIPSCLHKSRLMRILSNGWSKYTSWSVLGGTRVLRIGIVLGR